MIKIFIQYLKKENKSENTIKGYGFDLKQYIKWFLLSFDKVPEKIYHQNVLEYKNYLLNVKNQNSKTINSEKR